MEKTLTCPKWIGLRIKRLRREKHLSIEEVSLNLDISPSGWGRWENGARTPDARNLIKICDYFDVSIDWLLGRTDFMPIIR